VLLVTDVTRVIILQHFLVPLLFLSVKLFRPIAFFANRDYLATTICVSTICVSFVDSENSSDE